jgi:uncharacterized membrane protein (DUF106 family)
MQDIFGDFMAWFGTTFEIFKAPPYAAILIIFVSLSISTISNLAMKRFTDMRRLNRYQFEIKQFREMEQKAQKTQNEKLLKKVKRRKSYIERIQREQMTARCKPSLIFFIPFIFIFAILRGFYTTEGLPDIVAILPFNIQKVLPFLVGLAGRPVVGGFGLSFYGFYFLVGLGLSSILQRIMGTQVLTAQ